MSNCTNIYADDIGCLKIGVHQYQNKTLSFLFEEENPVGSGTYVPLDLTSYSEIKIQFREKSTRSGRLWREYDLTNELSISGADDNILAMTIPNAFYSDKMPTVLTFDILYEENGITNHYINGELEITPRSTAP